MNTTLNLNKLKSEGITIVAATKTQPIEKIKEAISAGINIIGENYVQEADEKYKQLKGRVKFHLIGNLQTNKVKKSVEIFDMIQTVDNIKIAKEIDKRCKEINKVMPVLIELNIGREENKSGCMPEELPMLVEEVSRLMNIKLEGLMTMAPPFEDNEKVRPFFKNMKKIYDILKQRYNFTILSMGMSNSYKVAIEEGSNMVRLGTVLFGNRE